MGGRERPVNAADNGPDTALEVRDYGSARLEIRDGDILLYRGRGPLSRWIRSVTGSPYSHAGIALWWEGRLVVLEAVRSGVVVTLLSSNVARYHGGVEWFRCTQEIDDERRRKMVGFAQAQLGKKYALWKAVVVFFYLFFNREKGRRDQLRRTGSLFCSHLVAAVYNQAGLDLKKGLEDRFMSPRDIAESPLLRPVAFLKHEDGRRSWWRELRRNGARQTAPPGSDASAPAATAASPAPAGSPRSPASPPGRTG